MGSNSCDCSIDHTGATTSVLLGVPSPRQVGSVDYSRDGLPALPHTVISSGVYRDAEDLPAARAFTDRPQLETNVQLLDVGDGAWCVNHALHQQQIYGGRILRDAYEGLLSGRLPDDAELTHSVLSYGFVAPP